MTASDSSLERNRALVGQAMRQILNSAEQRGVGLTADEQHELEALDAKFDRYSREIARVARYEKAMGPEALKQAALIANHTDRADARPNRGPNMIDFRVYEPPRIDASALWSYRALAGDVVDGSNVIAKDYADIIWSRLYKANPLLQAGMTEFETEDYSFTLPIGTASATVTVVGQGTAITASDAGFTSREIVPQRFGALTAVSNEFWADITGPQKNYILDDHIKAIGDSMESQMLSGSGVPGFSGLYGTVAAGTVTGGTVSVLGLAPYAAALGSAAVFNIQPTHFIVHPTDYGNLLQIKEGGTAVNGSLFPLMASFNNGVGGRPAASIFGTPILVTPNASAGTALLISAPQLIFVRRSDAEQMVDPYSLSNTYQTRLRTVVRAGFYAIPARHIRINALA